MTNFDKKYKKIIAELRSIYPEYPYINIGIRGGSLLFQALKKENCKNVLLPGFFCPNISAMVKLTGKEVVHVDIDPTTLHMNMDFIVDYLDNNPASETCLLIDHSFGYINSNVEKIRHQYPNLLIIEDCVRAFGGKSHGMPVGTGDWILLSMYKTMLGNDHGAILLSRYPVIGSSELKQRSSLNEILSTVKPLRYIYERIKRRNVPFRSGPTYHDTLIFEPKFGLPSSLVSSRYLSGLKNRDKFANKLSKAWDNLYKHLSNNSDIKLIEVQDRTVPSKHFLTFNLNLTPNRDDFLRVFLSRLHQEGFFCLKTWTTTPNYYRCFNDTYLYGDDNTKFLAHNVVHIAIAGFLGEKHQKRFLKRFNSILSELKEYDSKAAS